MNEIARTRNYLVGLAILLIVVVYWAGTKQVAGTLLSGLNTLGLTFTGRDASGKFAAYPGNAPRGGHVA